MTSLLATIIAALVGGAVFEWLRVPAGALVGAAVGVAAFSLAAEQAARMPPTAAFLTYVGIGWLVGQSLTRDVLRDIFSNAIPVVGSAIGLLAVGAILAFALTRIAGLDYVTAFLATSPGGLSQMSALGTAVGADLGLVVAVHLVRVFSVLLLAPAVVRFLDS